MKKAIYITAFTLLGFLLQLLAHGIIEKWYIGLLISDFERYGLGLSWENWFFVHHIGAILLFAGGIVFGYWHGRFWWRRIYENRRER